MQLASTGFVKPGFAASSGFSDNCKETGKPKVPLPVSSTAVNIQQIILDPLTQRWL